LFDSESPTGDSIPASTNRVVINYDLIANTVYIGRLRFERRERFEHPSYPGAKGEAIVYSEVSFYVAPLNFRIGRPGLLDGQVQFSILGLPTGRTYALSMSTDLRTWTRVKTVTVNSANRNQAFATAPNGERAFYRWELLL
jgi:hypothetical protein